MKFGYITCPIVNSTMGDEVVDLDLLNYLDLSKSQDAEHVTIRWTRSKNLDWHTPFFLGEIPLEIADSKTSLMRSILNQIEDGDNLNDPDALLVRWCREGRAEQVVFDTRIKKFVSVKSLKEDSHIWNLDLVGLGDDDGEVITVTADDEASAKVRGAQAFLKLVTDDAVTYSSLMANWFLAGRPVHVNTKSGAPVAYPDTVYCRRAQVRSASLKTSKKAKAATAAASADPVAE